MDEKTKNFYQNEINELNELHKMIKENNPTLTETMTFRLTRELYRAKKENDKIEQLIDIDISLENINTSLNYLSTM